MENALKVNVADWLKEVAKSTKLTAVYFWHERCPWCLKLKPVFDETSNEYNNRMRFTKVDVLENSANRGIASNCGIVSAPTLLFLCGGKTSGTNRGFDI